MLRRLAIIVATALLSVACGGGAGDSAADGDALSNLPDAVLRVDRGELLDATSESAAINLTDAGSFALSELTTRVALGVTVQSSVTGFVRVNGQRVETNRATMVPISRIAADNEIRIEHRDRSGALVVQTLRTRPQGLPSFTVQGQTSTAGEIALSPNGNNIKPYLLLLDGSGNIIYYRRSADLSFNDFKQHRVGARALYSYMQGSRILPVGYTEGKVFVMDENFLPLATIDGPLPNAAKGRPQQNSESHDFLILGDNHYLVSAYYGSAVDGIPGAPARTRLVSSVLQEIRNGAVVFEWDSTDHPELYGQSEENNNYSAVTWSDYVHFNSIAVDPRDGNFVVSFRNLNAIMKIDRASRQILWRYGGAADDFALTALQLPQGQHTAQMLADGSLLFFDNNTTCSGVLPALPRFFTPDPLNGNLSLCDQRASGSRIVKARLDEPGRRVTSTQQWRIPNDAQAIVTSGAASQTSRARGSVQQLANGNLFIGFGSNLRGERDVLEWDPIAEHAVFELYFDLAGDPVTQSDIGSYRAQFTP